MSHRRGCGWRRCRPRIGDDRHRSLERLMHTVVDEHAIFDGRVVGQDRIRAGHAKGNRHRCAGFDRAGPEERVVRRTINAVSRCARQRLRQIGHQQRQRIGDPDVGWPTRIVQRDRVLDLLKIVNVGSVGRFARQAQIRQRRSGSGWRCGRCRR